MFLGIIIKQLTMSLGTKVLELEIVKVLVFHTVDVNRGRVLCKHGLNTEITESFK